MTMSCDIGLGAYFQRNVPAQYNRNLPGRAVNALRRAGITTMEELCAVPDEELRRLRLLGEKSLELVVFMRESYKSGKATKQ